MRPGWGAGRAGWRSEGRLFAAIEVVTYAPHPRHLVVLHGAEFERAESVGGLFEGCRSGHAHIHGRIGQHETVAVAGGRGAFAGRGAFRIDELFPTGCGERDDAGAVAAVEVGEDFGLGAAVFRVVADVEDVGRGGRGKLGDERALMGGQRDMVDESAGLEALRGFHDAGGYGMIPQTEQEDVGVIGSKTPECPFEAPGDEARDAGIGLDDEDELGSFCEKRAESLGERVAAHAAPVQVVDAVVEGLLDGLGGRAVRSGESEGADGDAGTPELAGWKGHDA